MHKLYSMKLANQNPPPTTSKATSMPGKESQYDLVSDDGYDSRAFYTEEDFKIGIQFQARLVGKMDVARPSNRGEIVAAMRRIRYEFKAKAVKKRRVILSVSVEGVSVLLRKRKTKLKFWKESRSVLFQHPIHRVFYVSHDSQDLKIFSYIARDTTTNLFMCVVFKSYRKNQAIGIVGTIGQAFEVCHKLNLDKDKTGNYQPSEDSSATATKIDSCESETYRYTSEDSENPYFGGSESQNSTANFPTLKKIDEVLSQIEIRQFENSSNDTKSPKRPSLTIPSPTSMTSSATLGLSIRQASPEEQTASLALAQIQLLKDQLALETSARIEAQARAKQLLGQNKQLQDYLHHLVNRIQQLEHARSQTVDPPVTTATTPFVSFSPEATKKVLSTSSKHQRKSDAASPEEDIRPPAMFETPSFVFDQKIAQHTNLLRLGSILVPAGNPNPPNSNGNGYPATETQVHNDCIESPDSGHKEMSSDSLSQVMFWSTSVSHQPVSISPDPLPAPLALSPVPTPPPPPIKSVSAVPKLNPPPTVHRNPKQRRKRCLYENETSTSTSSGTTAASGSMYLASLGVGVRYSSESVGNRSSVTEDESAANLTDENANSEGFEQSTFTMNDIKVS